MLVGVEGSRKGEWGRISAVTLHPLKAALNGNEWPRVLAISPLGRSASGQCGATQHGPQGVPA